MKFLLNRSLIFFLLSLIFIGPTFANSLDCSQCSVNQQCTCELKLDNGTCKSGLWIVLKSEGNSLQIPVIAGIPPAKVSFTPTGEGKIKIMGFCFSTPIPVILKKEIEISASFLQCPATCKIGDSCTCTVNNCTDGLYMIVNKVNNPVDYNIYPYLSTIATDPYINIFKAKENGTVGIVAACLSPLPPKSGTADIIIGGDVIPQCTYQNCEALNTNCMCGTNKLEKIPVWCCAADDYFAASKTSCQMSPSCQVQQCTPGTCNLTTRKYCLSTGTWSTQDDINSYCINCNTCPDGACNCGENCSTCPNDCGICPPKCGDNNCDSGECASGCTQDCSITDCCGIEQCNTAIGENCSTCPNDCGICSPENYKDSSKFSSKQTFLISDENWRDVLTLIPLTTWTSKNDSKWCQGGYGTADNTCVYPTLIYHRESNAFDIDSAIYFMQQYSSSKVTIIGNTPTELDNLLTAAKPLGAGLTSTQITRIYPTNYLTYWKTYESVVYVEDNYELALIASTYASLINAPLIIQGYNDNINFDSLDVICVGNPSTSECDETYNLEDLQKKYLAETNTDNFILVNPNDLNIKVTQTFAPKKSGNSILELYTKTSLSAPILASAKHELIMPLNTTNYKEIDQFITEKFKNYYGFPDKKVCDIGESCSSGFELRSKEIYSVEDSVVYNLEKDIPKEAKPFRISFGGILYDCNEKYMNVELYNNGKLLKSQLTECKDVRKKFIKSYDTIYIFKIYNKFDSGNLELKFSGAKFYLDSYPHLFEIKNDSNSVKSVCKSMNDSCAPNLKKSTIIKPVANNISFFNFDNVDTTKKYYISINYAGYSMGNCSVYLNNNFLGNTDRVSTRMKKKYFTIPDNLVNKNMEIKMDCLTSSSKGYYYATVTLIPQLEDIYLTIIAAPNAIPYREYKGKKSGYSNYQALDQIVYADLFDDLTPDIYTGRIQGITISDVSAYVSRDLFYDQISRTNNIIFMAKSFNSMVDSAKIRSKIFEEAGYNVKCHAELETTFKGDEWKNNHLISYQDHGGSSYAGISYSSIPDLNNSIIFNDACLTCSTYNKYSFCNTAIRKGAIAHLGAVCVAWTGNNIYRLTMNGIYYENKTLGKAFKEAYCNYGFYNSRWMTTLFSDPTLNINPSHILKEPLIK